MTSHSERENTKHYDKQSRSSGICTYSSGGLCGLHVCDRADDPSDEEEAVRAVHPRGGAQGAPEQSGDPYHGRDSDSCGRYCGSCNKHVHRRQCAVKARDTPEHVRFRSDRLHRRLQQDSKEAERGPHAEAEDTASAGVRTGSGRIHDDDRGHESADTVCPDHRGYGASVHTFRDVHRSRDGEFSESH